MTTIQLKPRQALVALALVLLGSVSLFTTAAHATTYVNEQSPYTTGRANAGTPNSDSVKKDGSGQITSYGNSSITYNLPPSGQKNLDFGHALYLQNCASCHGDKADGNPAGGTPSAPTRC
jgi:cytochrome c5